MGSRVQLALVFHNHQPVGNFDHVIDQACDMAYLPLLKLAAKHPHVRFGLHTSGCLWEWLDGHRPEYGALVAELVQRGQIELLSGGMYEPILPVLPERDALWHLNRLNSYLEHRFGTRPQGMWCPERVWEPHLPSVLAQAGIAYTLLDDFHFRSSAAPEAVKTDYFLSSHAGHEIALLPISKKLRYTMPFQAVADTFTYLRELADEANHQPLAVFGDDGEKFGVWPDTYEWVYEKGWLNDFFTALQTNADWVELLLPGEVVTRRKPAGDVFIPCASYAEMGEWSRVAPDAKEDDPPGFWRNYFHKYPESYDMHRYGLELSERLATLRQLGVPEHELAAAADDLGRSQCNCAYWHGVFGGLYLNYLRQAVQHHLLRAEQALQSVEQVYQPQHAALQLSSSMYRLSCGEIVLHADSSRGLTLSRIDDLATSFCWTDVLARRLEAYHAKLALATTAEAAAEHASIHDRVIVKEAGLQERLVVDPHERVGFNSYFSKHPKLDQLMKVPESGQQPIKRHFDDFHTTARVTNSNERALSAIVDHGSFKLEKSVAVHNNKALMDVKLHEGMPPSEDVELVLEFNLTLLTDKADDRYLVCDGTRYELAEPREFAPAQHLALVDGWRNKRLVITSPQATSLIVYPVYTVSSSEGGFERTYQGSCILAIYHPMALLNGIHCELLFEDV